MCGSDRESINQCLNGHPDEYRRLVERYQAALLSFLVGRLGEREWAEEAAQETFVRAYFALGRLRRAESFFSWLIGIADRVVREQRRNQQRRQQVVVQASAERSRPPHSQREHELERAIAELPDPCREVVLLRYYSGLSCRRIAEQLSAPLGTVTKRLSRAYAMLRESLRNLDDDDISCEVES